MRRSATVVITAALSLASLASNAPAHDHVEPRGVLMATGGSQEGVEIYASWTRRVDRDMCVAMHRDGVYAFPPPVRHGVSERVRLRLFKSQRPTAISARAYRAVVLDTPVGPGEEIDFELRRRALKSGATVWDAVFTPTVVGDYYLDVAAEWRDLDCGPGDQSMRWTFHLSSY